MPDRPGRDRVRASVPRGHAAPGAGERAQGSELGAVQAAERSAGLGAGSGVKTGALDGPYSVAMPGFTTDADSPERLGVPTSASFKNVAVSLWTTGAAGPVPT